ncbi:hypothetical protein [Endozoicomonas arenosclerae]|uniref:hypothetical protein n=1 Tax=Endozoicomonas arenosclerae TaxID=1633495 RepID=UPI0007838DB9|nr:hypothetical protein [Endozoicomonas arenosclerae]
MRLLRVIGLLLVFVFPAHATELTDIRPHEPNSKPWSEQWFYYINDPSVGYFKISVQTYLTADASNQKEKAYLHFAYAPVGGTKKVFDYFYEEVNLQGDGSTGDFLFEVPDVIRVDQESVRLATNDFLFDMKFTGDHRHYWSGRNPGRNPFGLIGDLPGLKTDYFVYTMGTETRYQFTMSDIEHAGTAVTYLDKGWYEEYKSQGFVFIGGFLPEAQLMMTGGYPQTFPLEMWVGRFLSEQEDILIRPSVVGLSARKESDACRGYFNIEIKKPGKKVEVDAEADPASFYRSTMPSMEILGAPKPVMKSMNARITVKVFRWGKLVEEVLFPQGLLEFSGDEICEA